MDLNVKHRLIGAVILVSVAVIVLPLLLDGDAETYHTRSEFRLPDRPAAVATGLDPVEPVVEIVVDSPPVEHIGAGGDQSVPAPEAPMAERKVLSSWVVQVASFSSRSNADSLARRLQAGGYAAFVQSADVDGRSVYRVRVGPDLDRGRTVQMQAEIEQKLALRGRVLSYP